MHRLVLLDRLWRPWEEGIEVENDRTALLSAGRGRDEGEGCGEREGVHRGSRDMDVFDGDGFREKRGLGDDLDGRVGVDWFYHVAKVET
jgi:hypothetical protein